MTSSEVVRTRHHICRFLRRSLVLNDNRTHPSGALYIYCPVDRDASLSSSYVNMIGSLAKNHHSFKFVQNRSKIYW